MWQKLIQTHHDPVLAFQRWVLALVFFPHGAQKVFAWFGGYGFKSTLDYFNQKLQIPTPLATLAVLAESVGVLLLFTGFLSRLAAFGIFVNMVVALFLVHFSNGFFMNWSGQQAGEGFEYHLLAIGLAVVIMIRGGGAVSLDLSIQKYLPELKS